MLAGVLSERLAQRGGGCASKRDLKGPTIKGKETYGVGASAQKAGGGKSSTAVGQVSKETYCQKRPTVVSKETYGESSTAVGDECVGLLRWLVSMCRKAASSPASSPAPATADVATVAQLSSSSSSAAGGIGELIMGTEHVLRHALYKLGVALVCQESADGGGDDSDGGGDDAAQVFRTRVSMYMYVCMHA